MVPEFMAKKRSRGHPRKTFSKQTFSISMQKIRNSAARFETVLEIMAKKRSRGHPTVGSLPQMTLNNLELEFFIGQR